MKHRSLLWKIPLALLGVLTGLVLLLLVAVAIVLYVPSVRNAALEKGVEIANEKTDWDIDLGKLYLSPLHHSPLLLYRAYTGDIDLPVQVDIDSLFVGHRGQDTLAYIHALRLKANLLATEVSVQQLIENNQPVPIPPIDVEQLYLDRVTFHSDSLIPSVGVDAVVGLLDVASPRLVIAEGQYTLHGLTLADVFVGIDLRETPPDTAAQDTSALKLAIELPDGNLHRVHFRLTPLGMDIRTGSLAANATIDVGSNLYDARKINLGSSSFSLGDLFIPIDTLYGDACVELNRNIITSRGLHARSDAFGAKADLSATKFNLASMRVDVVGDAEFKGSQARLRGYYDIDNEAYDMQVDVDRVNLSPFLKDSTRVILAGVIHAEGRGINPKSPAMKSKVNIHLADAVYDNIDVSGMRLDARLANQVVDGTLHLPFAMKNNGLKVRAATEHQFSVSRFLTPRQIGVDYHTQMRAVSAKMADRSFSADRLSVDFATDSTTSLTLNTAGLHADILSPMHVLAFVDRLQPFLPAISDSALINPIVSLQDLTKIDTLRQLIPPLNADITLEKGSPLQPLIDSIGIDLSKVILALASDSLQTALDVDASIAEHSSLVRLPAANAAMSLRLTDGVTTLSTEATTQLTDGVATVHDLKADAGFWLDVVRNERDLNGTGCLKANELEFGDMDLGSREVNIKISPSENFPNSIQTNVLLDNVPLSLVDSILHLPDIDFKGAVRANATIDGLPKKIDISAEVLPLAVAAEYKPYAVALSLGETPIIMQHNHLDLNGLPVYGADSTFIAFTGGLDLDSMRLNVALEADSFIPVKLVKNGHIPVYGDLATDISGTVTGPLDSIVADVDVTILSNTDITYPIDKKNLAQVKPHGKVNVRYDVAQSELNLGGQINVDDGVVRYSPRIYPVMPFRVDSGSHVSFNGPIGKTRLAVSASQKVKADVQSEEEETRRVDFTTGVRVNGIVDSLGLQAIDFFLEAPKDEAITRELAMVDEETREGLAATLLATGMYVGESNIAAQNDGYALSSIINSRINAAMANSKIGKFMDVDISSAQTNHASGKSNDMNITLSKSFFKDKLRVTVGSTISDNPEVNKSNGLLTSLTADYKLTKDGSTLLRLFSQRDYNNILEGELNKSGLGVRATKEWKNAYSLAADAGIVYRSNNSIGPDLTLKSSFKNLIGKKETFTIKGNGAYYWALRNRHPGDPKKTDTYKLGVNTSLVFPYLHWAGDSNPDGDTRYLLGYQYENIAGGYGVHKLTGSFTYFIRSSKFITHTFTPLSLSVVLMKAESDDLLDKAAEYPQLIKVIAGDEFVPSVGYTFTYNDYRSTRPVNTMLDISFKESGNLINAIYCAFGYKWTDKDKPLGKITFNQFVKLSAELRNKFNLTDKVSIATRLFAGANIPLGNSMFAPLSEAFYTGGPNSLRASSPYAYGPGNFYSTKYNQNFFHAGDLKFEANFELRFPIVWKLFGAAFVDAGNVWNWYSTVDIYKAAGYEDYLKQMDILDNLYDGIYGNPYFAQQIALGTGAGLRLDIEGIVIRLDLGIAIHAPYQTYKYDKERKVDYTQPINTYFNIPSALDALRLNFGIGYPF